MSRPNNTQETGQNWSGDPVLDEGAPPRKARGPDPVLHQGPSDNLLLTDYTPWHGPNSENAHGASKSLAKGPNMALRKGPSGYVARGPNSNLVKGARPHLAKGSIFSQALKKDSPPSSKRL